MLFDAAAALADAAVQLMAFVNSIERKAVVVAAMTLEAGSDNINESGKR